MCKRSMWFTVIGDQNNHYCLFNSLVLGVTESSIESVASSKLLTSNFMEDEENVFLWASDSELYENWIGDYYPKSAILYL